MKFTVLRYLLAILVAFSNELFYIIFSPLTLYVTYGIVQLFTQATLNENVIMLTTVSFNFIPACTAATAYLIFTELILLTKDISLKQGLKVFFIGLASIFVLNIVRILTLILIYVKLGENYFDTVHLLFWHVLSTLFVLLVWIGLTKYYKIKTIPVYSDIKDLKQELSKYLSQ